MKRNLLKVLVFNLGFLFAAFGGLKVWQMSAEDADAPVTSQIGLHAEAGLPARNTEDIVEVLVESRDCWRHTEEPSVDSPGHVIASRDGGDGPAAMGPRATRQALEQIFNGADYGLTVYAFCV